MFGIKNIKLVAAIKTVGIITAMAVCGILGVGIVEVFGVTAVLVLALVILLGLLINMVYHSYLYQLEEEQRKQNING